MLYKTKGIILKLEYDNIVDVERISFRDDQTKSDNYIEIPRSIVSFQEGKPINIEVHEPDVKEEINKNPPKMIMNSILYLIRQSKSDSKEQIIQFSAGGLIMRITTSEKHPFRLRGHRRYKIIIY